LHPPTTGKTVACAVLWQDNTNYIHSGGDLRREAERYKAMFRDSPPLNDYLDPDDETEGSRSAYSARPARGPESDKDSDPPEDDPEHIIETITALENQVDHLCSLLDTSRPEFEEHLNVFRRMIETLPEHVGVDYNPQQRAHLLRMYGERLSESSQLAMQRLQRDLTRLVSLDSDSPYVSISSLPLQRSSYSSSGNNLQYLFVLPHNEPTEPSGVESPRPVPISLQRRRYTSADSDSDSLLNDCSEPDLDFGEPQHPLAETHDTSTDSIPDSLLDDRSDHIPDYGEPQDWLAEVHGEESAGLQQGAVFDRTRIHEDGRGEDIENCDLCIGWQRTMGPPRW
jgi:hypothetical protein